MKNFFIKFKILKLFIAIFLIGTLLSLVPEAKEELSFGLNKDLGPVTTPRVGYTTLASQFLMALGSAGASVRGILEVVRWFKPKKI